MGTATRNDCFAGGRSSLSAWSPVASAGMTGYDGFDNQRINHLENTAGGGHSWEIEECEHDRSW